MAFDLTGFFPGLSEGTPEDFGARVIGTAPSAPTPEQQRNNLLMWLSTLAQGTENPLTFEELQSHPAFANFSREAAAAGLTPQDLVNQRNSNISSYQSGGLASNIGDFMDRSGLGRLITYGTIAAAGAGAAGAFGGGAAGAGSGAAAADGLAPITVGASALPGGIGAIQGITPAIMAGGAIPALTAMPTLGGGLGGGLLNLASASPGGAELLSQAGQDIPIGPGSTGGGGGGEGNFLQRLFGGGESGGTVGNNNMNLLDWLGIGASAAGGLLQGRQENQAAETMNPWNINGAFGQVGFDPASRTANMTADPTMAGLRGMLGSNVSNLFGGAGANPFMQFAQGLGNEQMPGLFSGLQGALGNMPTQAFNDYNSQMGQARGIANQDVSGLINQRLGLLREQAAPQEQQMQQALEQRLFSQGRLGSTGGARNMEAFARGLGQADLGRQLEAQNLGMAQQGQNFQQAGLLGNMAGAGFQNALGMNELGVSRAGQRMQSAMDLFGFGNQLGQEQTRTGVAGLTGMLGMDQNLMNLVAMGRNLAASPYQAQMSSSSPLGGLLSGLGAMGGLYGNQQQQGQP